MLFFLWFFLSPSSWCMEGGIPMAYKGCCKIYFHHAEQFAEPFPFWWLVEAAELEKLIFQSIFLERRHRLRGRYSFGSLPVKILKFWGTHVCLCKSASVLATPLLGQMLLNSSRRTKGIRNVRWEALLSPSQQQNQHQQGMGYTSEKAVSLQLDVFWDFSKGFGMDKLIKLSPPSDNDSINTPCVLLFITETTL